MCHNISLLILFLKNQYSFINQQYHKRLCLCIHAALADSPGSLQAEVMSMNDVQMDVVVTTVENIECLLHRATDGVRMI